MPQSMLRGTTYTLEVLFSAWAPGKEFKAQQAFRIFGLRHPNVLPMETLVFNCLAISSNTANRKQSSPNRFEQNQHTHDDFSKICGGGPYLNKERALEGLWETHLQWNYSMLNQTHYRKRVLQTLQTCTTQSNKILQQPSIFKLTGMIYAMVHLPTNKMFVIMTHKNLRASFKQHWYSAQLRNTKFHQTIAKGKLREVMIWPLETAANYSIQEINSRKKYWIRTLLKPKIWVRKQTNTQFQAKQFLTSNSTNTITIDPVVKKLAKQKLQWRPVSNILSCQIVEQNMTKQSDEECESQGLTINAYQEKAGNAAFPVTSSVIVETEVSSADTLSVNTETPTLNMPNTEIHLAGFNQFNFNQYIDDSLNEVLEEMKKFEDDVMANFNKDVDHNSYRQLVTKWTDLVKIKFASAEQIWEEMKKYIDANPYKYHKLESVWNELSYQEYRASLSPKELQEEEAEAKKRSQQAKRFSRRPKDRHFYRNTNPFL